MCEQHLLWRLQPGLRHEPSAAAHRGLTRDWCRQRLGPWPRQSMQRLNESLSSLAVDSAAPIRSHEYVVRLGVVQVLVRIPISARYPVVRARAGRVCGAHR